MAFRHRKRGVPHSGGCAESSRTEPALYLPYDYQLVGAVFVESKPPSLIKSEKDLIPSMDREGFLKNQAFDELVESSAQVSSFWRFRQARVGSTVD